MKPMQIAMALLSAVMFFILAGVFMGVQLELNGTKLDMLGIRRPILGMALFAAFSDSGTLASMTLTPVESVMDWMEPRRALMSPITSPMYSSGVRTSTATRSS